MNATLEDGSGQADCFADNWAAWGLLEPGACLSEHPASAAAAVDGGALAPPPSLPHAPASRAAVLFRLARKHSHVVVTRARYVHVAYRHGPLSARAGESRVESSRAGWRYGQTGRHPQPVVVSV